MWRWKKGLDVFECPIGASMPLLLPHLPLLLLTSFFALAGLVHDSLLGACRNLGVIILALNHIEFLSTLLSRIEFLSTPLNHIEFLSQFPIKMTPNSSTLQQCSDPATIDIKNLKLVCNLPCSVPYYLAKKITPILLFFHLTLTKTVFLNFHSNPYSLSFLL